MLRSHLFYRAFIFILWMNVLMLKGQFYNGDFNLGNPNCTGPAGWSTSMVQVSDYFQTGNNWVDVTGCGSGNDRWIEQVINVTPGKIYFIRMDLGTWSEWDDEDAGVNVSIDGVTLGQRVFNDQFSTVQGWRLFWKRDLLSCTFIPKKNKVTVRITGNAKCTSTSPPAKCANPYPGVIAVDNVILDSISIEVPEKFCMDSKSGLQLQYSYKGQYLSHQTEWFRNGVLMGSDSFYNCTQTGEYTLKVHFPCATYESKVMVDTSLIEYKKYTMCSGDTILIRGKYLYQTGVYIDTIRKSGECDKILITDVVVKPSAVKQSIKDRFVICTITEDSVLIDPGGSYWSYKWYPGMENTASIFVKKAGVYWLVVKSFAQGCSDSIPIYVSDLCDPNCFIPNAFSPNGDGSNDFFPPVLIGVSNYKLGIFNRWGELLYQTDNLSKPWDGYYQNELCHQGVYVYLISFKASKSGESYKFSGTCILLR